MSIPTRPLTWLAAGALAVISLPATAMEPFTAQYQANYMGVQAPGTMTLAKADGNMDVQPGRAQPDGHAQPEHRV